MPGLDPGIHALCGEQDVDGRDKPGHDGGGRRRFRSRRSPSLDRRPAPSPPGSSRSGRCRWKQARKVSTTVVDRNGKLLRAYAMADGRWRLPVDAKTGVDPGYLKLLLAYEDRRFYSHGGVDPLALGRAALQLVTRGHIVSGGSTITMQLARLMEPRRERSVYAKLRQMVRAVEIERQLSKDADPRSLSGAGAVRRQSRRHPRRLDRLFRQGAEAAVAGGSGAAGGAAAIAGNAAGSTVIRKPRAPRATACSTAWSRMAWCREEDAAQAKAVAGAAAAQADADPGAAFRRCRRWRR